LSLRGVSYATLPNVKEGDVKKESYVREDELADQQNEKRNGDQPHSLLKPEVERLLLDAGDPERRVRFLGSLNGYASALNSSTNPVKAAQTMMDKEKFPAYFQRWLETKKQ
jgi:hypothetical protein